MGVPENIDALLVKHDITQEALARIAGVTPGAVTGWRKGSKPRGDAVARICQYFNITSDVLLSDSYGLAAKEHGRFSGLPVRADGDATVPLVTLGSVHAGPFSEEGETERTVDVPASLLRSHPRARALVVEGDCMNRVAPDGMAVVYDPDMEPHNGSVAIVETENYDAVMRRWYRGGDTLMLVADSYGRYPDIVLTEEDGPIRLVGTVVWVQSAKEMD